MINLKPSYLVIALIIYTITSWFSLGHLHPDEYYQILEFAAYKLGLNSQNGLTWEFYNQIRPSIQAWGVIELYRGWQIFSSPNPFIVAFLSRLFSAYLSLIAAYLLIKAFINQLKTTSSQRWFILLTLFSYLIVFNSVRYSSENIASKLFVIGLALLVFNKPSCLKYLLAGVLLGFSFICRYQVGFMILGLILWTIIINRLPIKYLITIITGLIIAILCGLILDHAFYNAWVLTPWRYFDFNILKGKASTFGTDPWYMYLSIAGFIPYGPLYLIASLGLIYLKPKHVLSWIIIPFVIAHLLVGHKELRFLTPLLIFMPLVILLSLEELGKKYNWFLGPRLIKLNKISWYFNWVIVLIVMFIPSAMQIRINQLLYKNYTTPTAFNYITEGGNILDFYKHPNLRPVAINTPSQVNCKTNENCILALTCQETIKYSAPKPAKLIFSDCPTWIFKLDFNGWLERTALYNIYQLNHTKK